MNTGRNAATFERGNHISMLVDPVDRGVIYVANIHDATNLWKSTNGGVDWDQLFPPGSDVDKIIHGFADAVSMDPNDHKHLIIGFHDNCEAPYAPACEAETTDSGATWRLFKLPTKGWEEGAGPWVIDATTSLYGGTSGLFLRPIVAQPGRTSAPMVRGHSRAAKSRPIPSTAVPTARTTSRRFKAWSRAPIPRPGRSCRTRVAASSASLREMASSSRATMERDLQHREDEQSNRVDQARPARRAAG